jgi:hypothetical protein
MFTFLNSLFLIGRVVVFFFFRSEWNDTKTNEWIKERKPELNSEDRNSALFFLNKKGIKSWNGDEVQLWLSTIRDGALVNFRDNFVGIVGNDLASLTEERIIEALNNNKLLGSAVYNAIRESTKTLTCFPLCSIQLKLPFLLLLLQL